MQIFFRTQGFEEDLIFVDFVLGVVVLGGEV
jgi:hypothetical protein